MPIEDRANPSHKPDQTEHVLVVEDSPTQRELVKFILEQNGYRVSTATQGKEALKVVHSVHPAAVISDILMPEMNGYELCRRIKADKSLRDVPVILLTALNDPKDVIEGLECGADNFIVKPFDEQYLLSRLEYMLSNRKLRDRDRFDMGVEIIFAGQKYFINSERRQILDLLLSTYEAAVRKNTELVKTQEELKQANADLERRVLERTAKLEEANKALESFCYTIAHDLRAPLRSIQGFTSMLLSDYGHAYDATGQEYAQRVINSAIQMDRLIQDLLAYGRITQAEFPTEVIPLEMGLKGVLELLSEEIRHRNATVDVEHPLPEVRANSTVLEQVLANLLSNALKFVKEGVRPSIRIWSEQKDSAVRLHIEDNGIGIDPAYAERIFRLFERLHDSREYPGTGIGLVIVRKGVERMGGTVGVDSALNRGSRFWIELPAA
jgi:two-component system, sensor histidine kinase and response regulator